MLPPLEDLLATARIVSLPLVTRFRGIDTREALLLEGPAGWSEFSPFTEYAYDEAIRALGEFDLEYVEQPCLPMVVSRALEASVGLSIGAHLAAALPELDHDCGLGTASLLGQDVTADPLLATDGSIPVRRVTPEAHSTRRVRRARRPARLVAESAGRCHTLLAVKIQDDTATGGIRASAPVTS